MLTNFATIRKAVKKMNSLDRLMHDKEFASISKRERLQVQRERAKLDKNLGSIADLTRLPSALFIVDINKEHIAVAEAKRLNIPTFAMVDTNCDPDVVDFAIPANDDASKSVALILDYVCQAIEEGMQERKMDKDSKVAEQAEEETDRLATELLDDEVAEEKEDNKIRKVKAVAEDNVEKRPRKQVSKKGVSRK
jgi:small subunit ribosomal protein S2